MRAFVYIATPTEWGVFKNGHKNGFKIGYTANPRTRNYILRNVDGYTIRKRFEFEVNSEREGLAVEKLLQVAMSRVYSGKVKPLGDDYFKTSKVTTKSALVNFDRLALKAFERALGEW